MTIVELVTVAIVSLSPRLSGEEIDRYAADIAAAADDDTEMAMALVATAHAESQFRPAIEQCRCTATECDRDAAGKIRALSLFQLHHFWWAGHSRAEICSSNRLAASLAASALTAMSHQAGGYRGAMRRYVGCRPGDPRHVKRIRTFDRLMAAARKAQ